MLDKIAYGVAAVLAAASLTGAAAWYLVYWPEIKDIFEDVVFSID